MSKKHTGRMILPGLIVFFVLAACDSNSAQSTVQFYRLSYNGNGNDAGAPPAAVEDAPGTRVTVAVNSGYLTKGGYYFAGWNTQPDGTGTSYKPGNPLSLEYEQMELYAHWKVVTAEKSFAAFHAVTTGETWYLVDGVKLAENDLCVVYGDVNANIAKDTAQDIADEYENYIHPKITGAFGDITYMPVNQGKLFLLLLDIQDGFSGSGGYVAGYFDSTHMYSANSGFKSNEAAMLFMDIYPGDPSKLEEFCTVAAHELQHLINFSHGKPKNTWINEGLSLAAEYLYSGEQITQRINYFNATNTTIPYGNNFFIWDGSWEQQYGDVLANYSTAYLFFRWLGIQAGESIYRAIVDSSHIDSRAITDAMGAVNPAFSDWKTLLGTWMLANYYQKDTGVYGYKNDLKDKNQKKVTLTVRNLAGNGSWYHLFPGEGVFSSIPQDASLAYTPEGNIYYVGLPASTPPPGLVEPQPYSGQALLSFNGNSNEKGPGENGRLASKSSAFLGIGRNSVDRKPGPLGTPPGNYPVDFREMAGKGRSGKP
jgi:hypothetical protein